MRLSLRLLLIGLGSLLLLSIAGVALAEESPQPPRGAVLQGRVQAKSAESFTLRTRRGEVTVSVDGDTRYHIPGVQRPTLADIQVGDVVLVFGRRNEVGTLLARKVAVRPPVPVGGLRGEVKAITGQTITLTTFNGEKALLTDEHTKFDVPNVEHPKLADVHVGDRIFAVAKVQPGGTLLAKQVTVLPEGARGPLSFRGRVASIAEASLKVRVRDDEVTVTITATTRIHVLGVENPTLSSIRTGDWVLVVGRPAGLSRVEARAIAVLPAIPAGRFTVRGVVKNIQGTTLSVEDDKTAHTVLTDNRTRFRVPDVEETTIADIHLGDHIVAIGKPAEGVTILARWIGVQRAPQAQPSQPLQERGAVVLPAL